MKIDETTPLYGPTRKERYAMRDKIVRMLKKGGFEAYAVQGSFNATVEAHTIQKRGKRRVAVQFHFDID